MTRVIGAFDQKVAASRKEFLSNVKSLPAPLDEVVIRNYTRRLNRTKSKILLGEYAPWFFADIAGIENEDAVAKFVQSWLNIYSYIIFVDDTIDRKDVPDRDLLIIAAGLLLQRGLSALYGIVKHHSKEDLRDAVDRSLTQAAAAATKEVRRRGVWWRGYSRAELTTLGHKVAALKLCAYCLRKTGSFLDASNLNTDGIDAFSTGMQLLDDVTDWEEDWRARIYTYPLALTFQGMSRAKILGGSRPWTLTRGDVLGGMVITKALERTLSQSKEFLERAVVLLRLRSRSPSSEFLRSLLENSRTFSHVVQDARKFFEEKRGESQLNDWFHSISRKPEHRKVLLKVSRSFSIVAQQS